MDILNDLKDGSGKKSLFSHIFSTTDEHNAEVLNGLQYTALGLLPIIALNKLIQRFVPEADIDKSTLELLLEVFAQLSVMIAGVILIHRAITFAPTYSGFKYETLAITNVILPFLIIILSMQTKVGIKVNIVFDRVSELWNGDDSGRKANVKRRVRTDAGGGHTSSQSDYLDGGMAGGGFPPAPTVQSRAAPVSPGFDNHGGGGGSAFDDNMFSPGPAPANSVLGSAFNMF
jgi:hypothetical protein